MDSHNIPTDAFGGDTQNCDHEIAAASLNNTNNTDTWNDTKKGSTISTKIASDGVTMKLAKSESTQHMIGMKDVYTELRHRPLQIRAHTVTHSACSNHDNNHQKRNTNNNKTMIVHFIRHGQGFHNLLADIATESGIQWKQFDASSCNTNPYMRKEVLDAPLTELGREQAQLLQAVLPQNNNGTMNTITAKSTTIHNDTEISSSFVSVVQQLPTIDIVYASPHCRTLQTGIIALQQYVTTDTPFIAHELLREESGIHICDQRRTIEQQRMEFPQYNFELFCPSNIDPLFRPQHRETKLEVASRIYQFMEFLATNDDAQNRNDFDNMVKAVMPPSSIAVVTHSGWLHTLFNAVIHEDCDPSLKEWWNTGELRTVELEFIWMEDNQ